MLGKVIEILKSVTDKSIRIEGHTDAVPISGTLTQRYPSLDGAPSAWKQGITGSKVGVAGVDDDGGGLGEGRGGMHAATSRSATPTTPRRGRFMRARGA